MKSWHVSYFVKNVPEELIDLAMDALIKLIDEHGGSAGGGYSECGRDEHDQGHCLDCEETERVIRERDVDHRADEKGEPTVRFGPVDRSQRTLTDGSPVTPGHREIDPKTGMQKDYVVLSKEERAKNWARPYRDTYTHTRCGTNTRMNRAIAETYARDPGFYAGGGYCVHCRAHFPSEELVWAGTNERVGS